MALISCPECGNSVSETAATCPSCGFALSPEVIAKQKTTQQKEQTELKRLGLAFLGLLFLCVLMCSEVFTGSSSSNTSPASYSSSPYEYNDSSDRYLKERPNMRGFSDSEKEHIIGVAKELDAKVKEEK